MDKKKFYSCVLEGYNYIFDFINYKYVVCKLRLLTIFNIILYIITLESILGSLYSVPTSYDISVNVYIAI